MRISKARLQAIARELVYDIVISEIDTGSVNRSKIAGCLDLEEDEAGQITDEMISEVEGRMGDIASSIVRRGRLARD